MNAYVTKEELKLLSTDRISHPEHYADARSDRHTHRPGLLGRVLAYFERQRVVGELSKLSDRELADIGLCRAELSRVFEPGFHSRRR